MGLTWAQDATLIVPGESVGKVKLGMTVAQVYGILGEPTEQYPPKNDTTFYVWEHGYFLVGIDSTGVTRIDVSHSRYATKEGIRVGSTEMAIEAFYGTPSSASERPGLQGGVVRFLHYRKLGLNFRIEPGGHVSIITIERPW